MAWQRTGGASTLLEWDGNVPSFDRVHEEVLHARQFMAGAVQPELITSEPKNQPAAVSNPVDFLVPEVMSRGRMASL
jgi:hypothetical protein